MSFILEALKKSENERARQNGPALLEARVLPPRRGMPVWAVVVGVILIANLALLAWVVLRTPPTPATVAAAPAPQPQPQPQAVPAPVPTIPAAVAPAPAVIAPPVAAPSPPPSGAYVPPGALPPAVAPAPPPPGAAVVNPADYAPARPAAPPGPAPRTIAPPARPTSGYGLDPTLPSASDLTASGTGLPPLRLALHAYADDPAERYVLINSQRLREGEMSSEGARVEAIAPEGVLMSWRGQRFRLLPGE